jgi:hypothetical protein
MGFDLLEIMQIYSLRSSILFIDETPPNYSSSQDFALLIFAVIIWCLGLFLYTQAKNISLHYTKKKDNYWLKPDSGWFLSWIGSIGIIILWIYRCIFIDKGEFVLSMFFSEPEIFAPGFLLASILPTIIGMIKFTTIAIIKQDYSVESSDSNIRRSTALVYTIFSLLNAGASIVTLYQYIFFKH